ncbi:MAG: c-type cytochrome, partial [Pedosphaera parvula]|nr:c-type cytochrome [Pedosphaera parvula]
KTLQLMAAAATQEEQTHYLFHLRTARNWRLPQRREYFKLFAQKLAAAQNVEYLEPDYPNGQPSLMPISKEHPKDVGQWFKEADRPYGDGSSFANFLRHFYTEAVANLTAGEKQELQPQLARIELTGKEGKKVTTFPEPKQRGFVKEWTSSDLLPELENASSRRNFNKGMQAFVDAQCIQCHRFGNEGGGIGPDLTAVAARFSRRDILESILEPSKVVSEQFQNTTVVLKDGEDVTGRLLDETADKLVLEPNPLQPEVVEVKKVDVKSRAFARLSPMPEGLVNGLTKEDILDLLAFLESAGRKNYAAFGK